MHSARSQTSPEYSSANSVSFTFTFTFTLEMFLLVQPVLSSTLPHVTPTFCRSIPVLYSDHSLSLVLGLCDTKELFFLFLWLLLEPRSPLFFPFCNRVTLFRVKISQTYLTLVPSIAANLTSLPTLPSPFPPLFSLETMIPFSVNDKNPSRFSTRSLFDVSGVVVEEEDGESREEDWWIGET